MVYRSSDTKNKLYKGVWMCVTWSFNRCYFYQLTQPSQLRRLYIVELLYSSCASVMINLCPGCWKGLICLPWSSLCTSLAMRKSRTSRLMTVRDVSGRCHARLRWNSRSKCNLGWFAAATCRLFCIRSFVGLNPEKRFWAGQEGRGIFVYCMADEADTNL